MKNYKLHLDKLTDVVNYFDIQTEYLVDGENGELKKFNFDECSAKGLDEDAFPETFRDFKKYGTPLREKVLWAYDSDENKATYFFDDSDKSITIFSDNFTMKECFTIIELVKEHLKNVGPGQFVAYGMEDDEEHTLWHEEATAFGLWINPFIEFYTNQLNSNEKFTSVSIFTGDYETDDIRFQTKDRVIEIVFDKD